MSLRWRFASILAGAAIAASAVAGAAAFWSTQTVLNREVDQFLNERLSDVHGPAMERLARLGSADQPALLTLGGRELDGRFNPFGRPGGFISTDVVMQVIDRDGNVTLTFDGFPVLDVPAEVAESPSTTFADVQADGARYRVAVRPLTGGRAVVLARDVSDNAAVLASLRARIFAIGLVIAASAAVAGSFIAGRTVKPVEELSRAADRVATTQDLATPIVVDRDDEVGHLAASFNTMLAALRDSREQQHRLVADASHELRTPLTSLRTNIEVLARSSELGERDRKALLDDVGAELAELTALVTELVDLATDRRSDEPAVVVDLAELAAGVAERCRRRTGRTIELAAQSSPVTGRSGQLDRAMWNLVENADKWSPPGAPIEIMVSGGRVEVRDHGPGIAESDLPRIFDRFYRADAARTHPGSGLGLAIVAQIVSTHGGSVFARNHTDGGAVVGFEIG